MLRLRLSPQWPNDRYAATIEIFTHTLLRVLPTLLFLVTSILGKYLGAACQPLCGVDRRLPTIFPFHAITRSKLLTGLYDQFYARLLRS